MLKTLELYTYYEGNVVSTLAPSILIWSPSFLHVTRTSIKVSKSSNFDPIDSIPGRGVSCP